MRFLVFGLLILLFVQFPLPQVHGKDQAKNDPLVSLEIFYRLPEAGKVFLLWGVNGWKQVPLENRPAGTELKEALMYTSMENVGNQTFVATVKVSAGDIVIETENLFTMRRAIRLRFMI